MNNNDGFGGIVISGPMFVEYRVLSDFVCQLAVAFQPRACTIVGREAKMFLYTGFELFQCAAKLDSI
jgi:hypothetical protein